MIITSINDTPKTIESLLVQRFDFVNSYHAISSNDMVVVFSHRASKTFSIQALEAAKDMVQGQFLLLESEVLQIPKQTSGK